MIKKVFLLLLCLSSVLLLCFDEAAISTASKATSASTAEKWGKNLNVKLVPYLENDYKISTEVFKNREKAKKIDIHIEYPKISGLGSSSLEAEINEVLKNAALDKYYEIENDIDEGTQWPVEYSVMYADDKLISVKFEGYLYKQGGAGGVNMVYSANVDMQAGVLINIDDLFDSTFKDNIDDFECVEISTLNADKAAMKKVFDESRNSFVKSDDNFLFTSDKFVIILPCANNFQFASPYEDLMEFVNEQQHVFIHIN